MTKLRRDGYHLDEFAWWVRENPRLDSKNQLITVNDIDFRVHKYGRYTDKGTIDRSVRNLMEIEEKAHGKQPTFDQRKTLYLLNQMHPPFSSRKFFSLYGPKVTVRWHARHLLVFSGAGLISSESILWNDKPISIEQLEGLVSYPAIPRLL